MYLTVAFDLKGILVTIASILWAIKKDTLEMAILDPAVRV
jgi:hypothetical protein